MKKFFLILIATGLVAQLLALGVQKIVPQTKTYFEKEPLQKVLSLFTNRQHQSDSAPEMRKVPFVLPTVKTQKHMAQKPIDRQEILQEALAMQAFNKLKKEQEAETERRRKRKKKEEQVVNSDKSSNVKKPAVAQSNYKYANLKSKLPQEPEVNLGAVMVTTPEPKKNEISPATVQDKPLASSVDVLAWQNLLLKDPSTNQFKPFLALYKNGSITKTQYYMVIKALQKSQTPAARNLAVLGASVEPSPEAFQILATAVYTETDKSIQQLAIQRITPFAKPEYVHTLNQAFMSGDIQSKMAATQGLQMILQTLKTSPKSLTTEVRQQLSAFAANLNLFVKSTTSTPSAQNIMLTARQTLADVNLILGIS